MYNSYFGFVELPFSVTPDPRFFYSNSLYQEAFSTLHYGIEARKGFIVVTGEAGTGKTTLLRMLMHNLESTVHTAFIFNTLISFPELLRLTLNDLGLATHTDDRLALMEQLNDYLIAQLKKGHIVSLLIDEAQNLGDEILEELRLLSNLETDKEKLIQIVLMGQPELERKLDRSGLRQFKQRVALRCRLAPLERREVGLYIDARLKIAGYEGKGLFGRDAVERIAFYSTGIPRVINVVCDNALLIAYAASKSKVSAEMIEEVARDLQLLEPSRVEVEAPATNLEPTKGQEKTPLARKGKSWNRAIFDQLSQVKQAGLTAIGKGVESARHLVAIAASIPLPKPTDHLSRIGQAGLAASRKSVASARHLMAAASSIPIPKPRDLTWTGRGALLGIVLLAGAGVVLSSRQSRDSLSSLAVAIKEAIRMPQEDLKQAKFATEALKERTPNVERQVQAPPPQERATLTRVLKQDVASIPETKEAGQSQIAQTPAPPIEGAASKSAKADDPMPKRVEPNPTALNAKQARTEQQKSEAKERQSSPGTFNVVRASFVRDKPRSDAAITATLQPGTRVMLVAQTGSYFQVRSLDNGVRGYVHREDAFFERSKK